MLDYYNNEMVLENIAREDFERINEEFINITRVLYLSGRADNSLMWGIIFAHILD